MATEVKIPAMGESISSGILAAWHVKDGDYVEKEQVLYELETDKITSEASAEVSGVISIQVDADEEVEIGQVVATIDESAAADSSKDDASSSPESDSPDEASAEPEAKRDEASDAEPADEPEQTTHTTGNEKALSPAARKAAEETGVDVAAISGSGKDGRVTKSDILKAADQPKAEAKAPETPAPRSSESEAGPPPGKTGAPSPSEGRRESRKKMSPLRRKIAERLVAATQEAAMLTTFNEVDMSAVMKLRKQHQERFVERHGIKLGFMSFFTKAVTHALQAVPQVNARIEGNEVVTQHYYDIGVAVGTDKGLMVPVLRDCDQKGFAEIEGDILNYAKAARDGKIQMSDLEGGVITISNGGIYGSMLSTPIINHPQPAILGLHNITERAVVVDGEIVVRPMMYLALSYDHRLIDGKEAVTFLVKVKEAIEDPARLLFGI
ncbi:MAG: 2-oxoglutarate dehydrogenase complex dihydrolipoyllysine-residue succinyltransferase [Verrucomicrobia bacterium]|jgi:2-oxoglutarate dehydrogenase E2 component (dihydrolipoamide succinyltransferase)|nr:2-oxoglutarate dehydrogenase complex dihydrolipoyllysine-residue succinyltransferase [Verrucomicrobiota bacterium]